MIKFKKIKVMNSITNTEIGKRFELIFQDLQSYTLPIMLPHRKLSQTLKTFTSLQKATFNH